MKPELQKLVLELKAYGDKLRAEGASLENPPQEAAMWVMEWGRRAQMASTEPTDVLTMQAFGLLVAGIKQSVIRAAIEDAISAFV